MRKVFWSSCLTFVVTVLLTVGVIGAAGVYYIGGYFADLAFKRGTVENPQAPPAVFRTVFLSNGGAMTPAAKPRRAKQTETWTLHSFDGLKLVATHFAPQEETNRWVILVHGYGMSQAYTWNYAEAYLREGYHVLTPDMRASGASEGTYLTMGARESRDVGDWAARIARENPQAKIVLHGVSMGGATVLLAGARSLPGQVKAVVEDAGYTSLYGLFDLEMRRLFDVPGFPLLNMADIMCQHKAGFAFAEVDPVRAVRQAKLPVLFVHGGGDMLIPVRMEEELYAACTSPKQQLIVPKAAHAAAYQHRSYYPTVFRFLEQYVGKE